VLRLVWRGKGKKKGKVVGADHYGKVEVAKGRKGIGAPEECGVV